MQFAISETRLPGADLDDKLRAARDLGYDGVEFPCDGLTPRVPQITDALAAHGLRAAAVDAGFTRLVHPDYAERDRAIARVRQAMADALDLGLREGSGGVVFVSHFQTDPVLPDLRPYKSAQELEAEMLIKQLRATLTDLAYAMGSELYLLPVSRTTAHLVNRLSQAARVRAGTDNHPHILFAADLDHLALEEDDPLLALREHAPALRYVRLNAAVDHAAALETLRGAGYDGWLTLTDGSPAALAGWR